MVVIGEHRHTQVHVDLQAIKHNIDEEMTRKDPLTELWAVVKANGYGHGIVPVAQAAKQAGATGFCVAILDEALALRRAGLTEPILVLGIVEPEYAALIAEQHISVAVGSQAWLDDAAAVLTANKVTAPLAVHLALDTGMGRIGFQTPADLSVAVQTLRQPNSPFDFEGIFTHFATADQADDTYFMHQIHQWQALIAVVDDLPRYVHVSNSATSLWHQACNGNLIRFGVALYGLNPSGTELTAPYHLQPALSLTAALTFVKPLAKGQSVSYGATYTAQQDEWVGTVPIGYADGYERRLQGFHVLIDGQFCEIVGRICMDQLMVRLPKQLPVGTKVTLVGTDGDQTISLQDVADYCGTIHYEIACGLATRVPRVYTDVAAGLTE
ncbi:alanine racemase [Lactiplantibacillus mudanjiangensis]|uniref:Alanine racemase n=1 Tax=Lactiplantibacillus mudanjiangensis TaxID=1296538 RepID=A0A660E9B0_9LACO|nr:alanine racemase [Lactiplantibacillus mudanjiangensis]VDG21436.1 alanine racemase [Lactobacillus plantarum JDM1] [Lactiplantibacillus mudanjiangensis]VDG26118.1 alanine racemase [Lactobacillus plantarum JDM1] [Lactiplantibacillus mudanjiangensis]VDG29043.1 alanine racemase [Lactobacillus plantarum JDM1] [Lactiplantibacillus mudanjiangensis]VDG31561.1 alanine racemase [Lactobacillus plantarum JDM1] [Lactiplantibacillus mudanjiangensis]